MEALFYLVKNVDVEFYYWLSRFHGSWGLDRVASHLEANLLFKCGLVIAAYWYFWFLKDQRQEQRRVTILVILTGTIAGLFVTRMIAALAPFRVRPIYDAGLQHRALSMAEPTNFMNWSAFPSDHAAYLFALGFGLIWLSRRLAVPVVLFLAVGVCLPRLYLGIHYLSDVVVGGAIGVFFVWAATRFQGAASVLFRRVVAFSEARPQVFYPIAFLAMFEMAILFADVRTPVRAALHLVSVAPEPWVIAAGLALLVAIMAGLAYLSRSARSHGKELPSPEHVDRGLSSRPHVIGSGIYNTSGTPLRQFLER